MTEGDRIEIVAELEPTDRTPGEMAYDLGEDLRGTTRLDVFISTVHETAYLVRWEEVTEE